MSVINLIDYIEDVNGKIWKCEESFSETNFNSPTLPKYYPACDIQRMDEGTYLVNYFDEEKFNKETYLLSKKERFEKWGSEPNSTIKMYPNGIRFIKYK